MDILSLKNHVFFFFFFPEAVIVLVYGKHNTETDFSKGFLFMALLGWREKTKPTRSICMLYSEEIRKGKRSIGPYPPFPSFVCWLGMQGLAVCSLLFELICPL